MPSSLFAVVPGFQPVPVQAPIGLIKPILIVGFYLHALPMNLALMGGIVSACFLMFGQRQAQGYATRLGNSLALLLPFSVSFAITMGIVPLLFLQLIYGPLFYTSSILMAVPWLALIFVLLIAYYGYYIYIYQRKNLGGIGSWVLWLSGFLFMIIAFLFSNNMTLMLTPERWSAIYQGNPYGLNLNLDESQLLPRYLHFVLGALAVTGLSIGCFGWYWNWRGDTEYSKWLIQKSAWTFLIPTLLQIPVGVWFMLSLPRLIMMGFMGQDLVGTGIFAIALLFDLIAMIAMMVAATSGRIRAFQIGFFATLTVIFLMVIMRHLVRVWYTQPFFQPESATVAPEWLLISLFLIATIGTVLYMAWLASIAWRAFHPNEKSPDAGVFP